MKTLYTFEIFRSQKGKKRFHWRAKASNGRITAGSGEGYNRKEPCMRFIKNIKSLDPNRIQIKDLT
jgi:uncharacterized protein YegP (UPF0339 family)